jgi:hypothetical protein
MKTLEVLGQTETPDGTDMKLTRRDNEYIILANGKRLMSSRMHGSEEALATLACQRARMVDQPCVLVGGLGMGFTLRATLDILPADANICVAELVPAIVDWNRDLLGHLARHPLKDTACRLRSVTLQSRSVRAVTDSMPCYSTWTTDLPHLLRRTTPGYSDLGLAAARVGSEEGWGVGRLVCPT